VVTRVQAEANRLSDTAALFIALGGGWPASCTSPVWRECAMGEGAGDRKDAEVKSSELKQPESRI
jgi:hypothetical protein